VLPFSLQPALRGGALVLDLQRARRLISSAPYRGGLTESRWWVNHHVPLDFCEDDAAGWIEGRLNALGLPAEQTTACLTAAYVENYGHACRASRAIRAHALVTTGLSNLSSPGLTPPWPIDAAQHTINACLAVEAALPDAALVELVQIVTETKSRLLAGALTAAGHPATGTSTDTVTVIALGGPPSLYAGAVTDVGHAAARAFEAAFIRSRRAQPSPQPAP
jgi:adenosylcobinamide amidohydrolase